MFRKGGLALFFVGLSATTLRDLTFGGVFSFLRHEFVRSKSPNDDFSHRKGNLDTFFVDLVSASIATVCSSPMNYVRDMHYATPPDQKVRSITNQLIFLWKESQEQPTSYDRWRLLQRKLRIGWGTARVGCGMAFSSLVYSWCSRKFGV